MRKDLLRSLLTSFRGSHKSVPQQVPIVSDPTINSGYQHSDENTFVAPADGFLSMQAEPPTIVVCIRDGGKLDWTRSESPGTVAWPVAFMPCKRGSTYYYYTESSNATSVCHLRFYPNVGE